MQYLICISYRGRWLLSLHQATFQVLGRHSFAFSSHNDPVKKEAEAQRGEAIYSKHTASARARIQVQVPVSWAHILTLFHFPM